MAQARKAGLSSWPSMKQFMTAGFGVGIGSMLATMIFITVAIAFFIPGYILVKKENTKPKDERSTGTLVTGYILMGLGMIAGMGFGSGVFFSTLGENI